MTRADISTEAAAQWIVRQEDGPWTETDAVEFDAWLAQNDGNRAAYWRLKHSWREADRIRALARVDVHESRYLPPQSRRWVRVALAASLIISVTVGLNFIIQSPRSAHAVTRYTTSIGEQRTLELPDGTSIELNTDSQIRAIIASDRREIWLDKGEVYFSIRHSDTLPFVVHVGDRRVTDLGTKFSIRYTGNRTTVAVVEGLVKVEEIEGEAKLRPTIIGAGDVAIAQEGATLVTHRAQSDLQSLTAWRGGMLDFNQERLADVAAEFNRYNRTPTLIVDRQVADLRIGGLFPISKPAEFGRLLSDAYGLKLEKEGDTLRISE